MAPRVVIASGHRTDEPDRIPPRFPDSEAGRVAAEIRTALLRWAVGPSSVLVCGGARGADLIAAEEALALGAEIRLVLALPVEEFVAHSVRAPETDWENRFRSVLGRAQVDVLGDAEPNTREHQRAGVDTAFARTNESMIKLARSLDAEPYAVLVWNGRQGDGPGGTSDLLALLRGTAGLAVDRTHVVDPTPRAYVSRELPDRPKRILSLDGGGMRGALTLEILAEIERSLRERYASPQLVLADYFDYIAGTSTGAIVAAALALGNPIDVIRDKYVQLGKTVFRKRFVPYRLWSLYGDRALTEQLRSFYGDARTLGDPELRTLLLIVMHNTVTDSPWPLTNCTRAKYNRAERLLLDPPDRNLDLPLGPLIRASTAAPIYFPPQELTLGSSTFQFQDGGITTYNNPALLAVVMATLDDYGLNWPTGPDSLLVVSVGTGSSAAIHPRLRGRSVTVTFNAKNLPGVFMNGAAFGQDMLCRALGQCRFGPPLDREVGTRIGHGSLGAKPLFAYVRYNADLGDVALQAAGIHDARQRIRLRKLDAVGELPILQDLGRRAADDVDLDAHFAGFLPASLASP